MKSHIQVLLLPGLGGDHRMAYPQLSLPYQLITPDLITLNRNESLTNYSRRLWEHLLTKYEIDLSRPLFLGGYSFGSAVAQEMAGLAGCNGIILIGGLRSGYELHPFIRWFGIKVALRVPLILYYFIGLALPPALRRLSEISEADIRLCQQMYLAFPRGMFRRGFKVLSLWEGHPVTIPLLRIQGAHDHIVSNISPEEALIAIDGAKHLVNFSKSEIVNREIVRFIDELLVERDRTGDSEFQVPESLAN